MPHPLNRLSSLDSTESISPPFKTSLPDNRHPRLRLKVDDSPASISYHTNRWIPAGAELAEAGDRLGSVAATSTQDHQAPPPGLIDNANNFVCTAPTSHHPFHNPLTIDITHNLNTATGLASRFDRHDSAVYGINDGAFDISVLDIQTGMSEVKSTNSGMGGTLKLSS